MPELALELLQAEVAVLDLHGWADVDLDSDGALGGVAGGVWIVVDDDTHDVAVDCVDEGVAADD